MTTSALWLVAATLLLARAAPPDVLGFTSMESPQHVEGEPRVTISYPRPIEPRVASTSSMLLEVHAYALRQSGLVIYCLSTGTACLLCRMLMPAEAGGRAVCG